MTADATMSRRNQQGSSLIEALIAVAILATALVSTFGTLTSFSTVNGRNQTRSNAAFAARAVIEELRYTDPETMPSTGSQTTSVTVGQNDFVVTVAYCTTSSYCSERTRHISVSISEDGQVVFSTETVFTQLR